MSGEYFTLRLDGAATGNICFHAPERLRDSLRGYAERVEQLAAPRAAPELHLFEDVIFDQRRRFHCLYDRHGRRIPASELVRAVGDAPSAPWATEAMLPPGPPHATIERPVVFHSVFFKQWGHFLLESLARMWAAEARPELAGLESVFCLSGGETGIAGRYAELLARLGAPPLAELEPGRRLRLAKVYVPTPSFELGTFAHPQHLAAPRRLARATLGAARRDDRPVYLSRADAGLTNHKFRRIVNEAELEAALAARGARIVHMQQMSLAEQIELINTHRVFIGVFGSAFHNLLFCLDGREVSSFVLLDDWLPRDFLLVDMLIGNRAHYVVALERLGRQEETRLFAIDVEATLGYLKANGAI